MNTRHVKPRLVEKGNRSNNKTTQTAKANEDYANERDVEQILYAKAELEINYERDVAQTL